MSRQVFIPKDFQQALRRNRLLGFFTDCAYVHRAGYLRWIMESVRPATRRKRIDQSILRLWEQRIEVRAWAENHRRCA